MFVASVPNHIESVGLAKHRAGREGLGRGWVKPEPRQAIERSRERGVRFEPRQVHANHCRDNLVVPTSNVAGSPSTSSSASAITPAATGPARSRRNSARPRGASCCTIARASSATDSVKRRRTSGRRNASANGSRWRVCSAPSSDSMLGPSTCAVEKRGSSTVNVVASRMISTARSRPVTSHAPRAGTHEIGSAMRNAASVSWKRRSSCSAVMRAPTGKIAARSLTSSQP
jgi:hypothetical protein